MGGSLDGCRAILPLLPAGGVAAFAIETAELVHARRGLLALADVVVLVSQSGRSAEALRLADVLGEADADAIGNAPAIRGADAIGSADARGLASREGTARPVLCLVTNLAPNPAAVRTAIVLETRAGHEVAPSTMSYTASIVTLGAVAAVLGRVDPGVAAAEAAAVAEAAARAVEALLVDHAAIAQEWRAWLGARRTLFVLGRGRAASVAGMSALLFKEATLVHAEAMSGPTFRHGPLEQAGPDAAVAIVALDPGTTALDAELATDMLDAGSPVAWIGPPGTAPARVLACPVSPLAGPAAVIPAAVPLQLLAWRLARERGTPGAFRVGGKVTTKE